MDTTEYAGIGQRSYNLYNAVSVAKAAALYVYPDVFRGQPSGILYVPRIRAIEMTSPARGAVRKRLRRATAPDEALIAPNDSDPREAGTEAVANACSDPEVHANQVWKLQFVLNEEDNAVNGAFYQPSFTHQIFPNERIRGYLEPNLYQVYDAVTLHCYLNFKYTAVVNPSKEVTPVMSTLQSLLDECGGYTTDYEAFRQCSRNANEPLETALKTISTYDLHNETFIISEGVLCSENKSPAQTALRALHRRLQFLTLLYIEAASFIDDEDPRWMIYLCRSRRDQRLVGFATVYRFPAIEKLQEFDPHREKWRLAQLLILPPYQRAGHGTRFLHALYERARCVSEQTGRCVLEISIEDPAPALCCVRDLVDLEKLLTSDDASRQWAQSINASSPVPSRSELKTLAQRLRITAAQVRRLYEILRLHAMVSASAASGDVDPELEREYRLVVKRRLFRENEECFGLKNDDERKQMLAEMYTSLMQESYHPVIAAAMRRGLIAPTRLERRTGSESELHVLVSGSKELLLRNSAQVSESGST